MRRHSHDSTSPLYKRVRDDICLMSPLISQIKKYEKDRVANDSTYWLIFELLWRDFFRYSAVKNGNSIFHLGGPRRDAGRQKWLDDTGSLEAWKAGETGYPFIDANMRELKASGFMSNRYGRLCRLFCWLSWWWKSKAQNTSSGLCKGLVRLAGVSLSLTTNTKQAACLPSTLLAAPCQSHTCREIISGGCRWP